jgi:hypothetical protein
MTNLCNGDCEYARELRNIKSTDPHAELARVRGLLQRGAVLLDDLWRTDSERKQVDTWIAEAQLQLAGAESADIGKLDTADEKRPIVPEKCRNCGWQVCLVLGRWRHTDELMPDGTCDKPQPPDYEKQIENIYNAAADSVLELTDEQIIQETKDAGLDPAVEAERVRQVIQRARGSAETGGEKAAHGEWTELPSGLVLSRNWDFRGHYAGNWWSIDDKSVFIPNADLRAAADFLTRQADICDPTFPRSSQNQTASSGVEGAHEGTTADETLSNVHLGSMYEHKAPSEPFPLPDSREPEKLNNAQKVFNCSETEAFHRAFGVPCSKCESAALAESSLSHHSKYPAVRNVKEAREKVASLSSPPPKRHCGDRHLAMQPNGHCLNCGETERPCDHPHLDGIDQSTGPDKVWECQACKGLFREVKDGIYTKWVPTFRQSPSLAEPGAESVHSGKQNTADKSELLPTQLPKENP